MTYRLLTSVSPSQYLGLFATGSGLAVPRLATRDVGVYVPPVPGPAVPHSRTSRRATSTSTFLLKTITFFYYVRDYNRSDALRAPHFATRDAPTLAHCDVRRALVTMRRATLIWALALTRRATSTSTFSANPLGPTSRVFRKTQIRRWLMLHCMLMQ